jgi:hypothetical protein
MSAPDRGRSVEQEQIAGDQLANDDLSVGFVFPQLAGTVVGRSKPEMADQLIGEQLAVGAAVEAHDVLGAGKAGAIVTDMKKTRRDGERRKGEIEAFGFAAGREHESQGESPRENPHSRQSQAGFAVEARGSRSACSGDDISNCASTTCSDTHLASLAPISR